MAKSDTVFITGHQGLLGQALVAQLTQSGYTHIVTASRQELDLTEQTATTEFIRRKKPKTIVHCAALVGGIQANMARPAEFSSHNLAMQNNVIRAGHEADVETLVFFGSNCMYPTAAAQPMSETALLTGPIEPTNLAYGSAKVAGYVECQSYFTQYGRNYFTVIPASLYGPHDCFDVNQCHVTPALLLRMHQAKKQNAETFTVWGSGKPRRELLFVADAARGVQLLLEQWHASKGPVNLGAGDDLSVLEIAETMAKVVGFTGRMVLDPSKPDGSQRKLLDSSKANALGFRAQTSLEQGLKITYDWLRSSSGKIRGLSNGALE